MGFSSLLSLFQAMAQPAALESIQDVPIVCTWRYRSSEHKPTESTIHYMGSHTFWFVDSNDCWHHTVVYPEASCSCSDNSKCQDSLRIIMRHVFDRSGPRVTPGIDWFKMHPPPETVKDLKDLASKSGQLLADSGQLQAACRSHPSIAGCACSHRFVS
jgi:hypothetical protein